MIRMLLCSLRTHIHLPFRILMAYFVLGTYTSRSPLLVYSDVDHDSEGALEGGQFFHMRLHPSDKF